MAQTENPCYKSRLNSQASQSGGLVLEPNCPALIARSVYFDKNLPLILTRLYATRDLLASLVRTAENLLGAESLKMP